MFSFKRADVDEIQDIQAIANVTWPHTYEPLLGKAQVNYTLNLLYSRAALQKQFTENHYFYFVYQNNELAGFASFGLLKNNVWKLYKLYLLPQFQGSGTGNALLQFVVRKIISLEGEELLLNVNRRNKARFFYEKNGFSIKEEADIDIGNGFFMNDYIMLLDLKTVERS